MKKSWSIIEQLKTLLNCTIPIISIYLQNLHAHSFSENILEKLKSPDQLVRGKSGICSFIVDRYKQVVECIHINTDSAIGYYFQTETRVLQPTRKRLLN